jgi:uncharacterized protein
MTSKEQVAVPVAPSIWEDTQDGPRLLGSRCIDCDTHAFPPQQGCQRCTGTNTESVLLANEGTLWTFTIQGFAPKSPPYIGDVTPFTPFGVGYVELAGQVKVEARLTESDPAKLEIGMPVKMVLHPLTTNADGNSVVTFAFKPTATSNQGAAS